MMATNRLAAFCLLFFLAGCASVQLIDPAKPASVGEGVSVMPQVKWNQISAGKQLIWTQNGPGLDMVRFSMGVKSGSPIYSVPGLPKEMQARFDSKMLPNDVQDLLVTALQKEGAANVRPGNLTPCPFGATQGFCFDLAFATRDGLMMKGKAIASQLNGKLNLITFQAPAEYYYENEAPTVTSLFASLTAGHP